MAMSRSRSFGATTSWVPARSGIASSTRPSSGKCPNLLAKLDLGLSWLERVAAEQSIETLRATTKIVTATHFWAYVITTLPRGAAQHADDPGSITYDLEGTLWMGFYEMLAHIRTIQRLKVAQGLEPTVELPRVGYLHACPNTGATPKPTGPRWIGCADRSVDGFRRTRRSRRRLTAVGLGETYRDRGHTAKARSIVTLALEPFAGDRSSTYSAMPSNSAWNSKDHRVHETNNTDYSAQPRDRTTW